MMSCEVPLKYRVIDVRSNVVVIQTPDGREFILTNRPLEKVDDHFASLVTKLTERLMDTVSGAVRLLDLGGGKESKCAQQIAEKYKSRVRVTNIDIAVNPFLVATPNVIAIAADATRPEICIPKQSIDLVYSCWMLPFMNDQQRIRLLEGVSQVLKPSGVALLDLYPRDRFSEIVRQPKIGLCETRVVPPPQFMVLSRQPLSPSLTQTVLSSIEHRLQACSPK